MNKGVICAVTFTVGAVIGSLVTWKATKTKYERIADAEIKDMKEHYAKKMDVLKEREENLYNAAKRYGEVLKQVEYDTMSDIKEEEDELEDDDEEEDEEEEPGPPFVIHPDEYNMYEDYDCAYLTYYSDGILADDMDEIIDDVDFVVGKDFSKYFGEFDDDAVFIRNPTLKVDYEIARENATYYDVVGRNPHQMEVK